MQASLDLLGRSIEDPIWYANELLYSFGKKLSGTVDMHNFKLPELLGRCRRRLEEFVDTLLYQLFPRFCPFNSRDQPPDSSDPEHFPAVLPTLSEPLPKPSDETSAPRVVYLSDVVERADKYVAAL